MQVSIFFNRYGFKQLRFLLIQLFYFIEIKINAGYSALDGCQYKLFVKIRIAISIDRMYKRNPVA